jgi:hypothetical protein
LSSNPEPGAGGTRNSRSILLGKLLSILFHMNRLSLHLIGSCMSIKRVFQGFLPRATSSLEVVKDCSLSRVCPILPDFLAQCFGPLSRLLPRKSCRAACVMELSAMARFRIVIGVSVCRSANFRNFGRVPALYIVWRAHTKLQYSIFSKQYNIYTNRMRKTSSTQQRF